ncbi:MAG: single-stranded DNA-binding protein [Planctomycetes bacterium]|nr:single-stranded DNA-binding protein [Planctomycetota bacterium]
MSASYNRVVIMGNLTADIDLRYTNTNTAVTDVTVAINDRRKSASGEWVEETVFVDVTLWGRTAEVASEYLSKGSPVFIEGRLKLDRWETDGQKRSKLRVVCEKMQMVGGRGEGGGGGPRSSRPQQQRPQYDESEYSQPVEDVAPSGRSEGPQDDIPF